MNGSWREKFGAGRGGRRERYHFLVLCMIDGC